NLVLLLFFALSAALNLGGNLVLVPMLGILGAAWTTFLAYALQATLVVVYARRLVSAPFPISVALRTCVAGGAVYAVARLVPGEGWWGFVLRVVAGISVYALLVFILRLVKREELSWFRRGLGRRSLSDSGNADA
ncbi:MAG: polysaccharide biosynthesis C-terminal domain-containing protein, partial [Candidatus Bipolaricaulia bacterium]